MPLYIIAFWAILTGLAEMVAAVALRREIAGEWALFLVGVLSVILGVVMAVLPGGGCSRSSGSSGSTRSRSASMTGGRRGRAFCPPGVPSLFDRRERDVG